MLALRIAVVATFLTVIQVDAIAQPSFRGTGVRQAFYNPGLYARIADDGRSATFTVTIDQQTRAYRWTEAQGAVLLSLPTDGLRKFPESYSTDISADGSRIVGRAVTATQDIACLWFQDDPPLALAGSVHPFVSRYQYAISADGNTIVGTQESLPTRWASPSEPIALPTLSGAPYGDAWDVSGNGGVVVGTCRGSGVRRAFRWTESEGTLDLGDLGDGRNQSSAWAVSSDGTTILGRVWEGGSAGTQVRWIAGQGISVIDGGWPIELSGDGSTLVGMSSAQGQNPPVQASIWDQSGQCRPLAPYLQSLGVPGVDNWHLLWADDVSADGQNIIGIGRNPSGRYEYWIARIGPLCAGDTNASGTVDLADLAVLLAHFGTSSGGTPSVGDFDDDGAVGVEDLLILLANFGVPCP